MIYKKLSYWLLSSVTAILCLLAIMFSTPWGTQFTLLLAGKFSPVQAEYSSGTLLNNLQLTQFDYGNEQVLIKAKKVRVFLHLRCIWKKQLCLDELSVDSLNVKIEKQTSDNSLVIKEDVSDISDIPPINFPISVDVKNIAVNSVKVTSPTAVVEVYNFSSDLLINGDTLTTTKTGIASIKTQLLSKESPVTSKASPPLATTSPFTETPWPLAELPSIKLPFILAIKSFSVKNVLVKQANNLGENTIYPELKNIFIRLNWVKEHLKFEQLTANIPDIGDITLKGNTKFIAPYQVNLTLINNITRNKWVPQINDSTLTLVLSGDLSQLEAKISSEGAAVFSSDSEINLIDNNLPYKTFVEVTQFTLPDELNKAIEPSRLSFKSQGNLNQQTLELNSNVSGYGYKEAQLQINLTHQDQKLQIHSMEVEDTLGNNHLSMRGELILADEIYWELEIESTGLTIPKLIPQLSGRLNGEVHTKGFWSENAWSIAIVDTHVKGELNQKEFNAKLDVNLNHLYELLPSELSLSYGESKAELKGFNDDNWHVTGLVDIDNTNIWLPYLDSHFSSAISISGLKHNPEIDFKGVFANVNLDDFTSDEIKVSATYSPLNKHKHQLLINSDEVLNDDIQITGVQLSSRGDLLEQKVNLFWSGDSAVDVAVDGYYSPKNELWAAQIENPRLTLADKTFQLKKSLKIAFRLAEKTFEIQNHCWLSQGFELCLKDDTLFNQNSGKLNLSVNSGFDIFKPFLSEHINLISQLQAELLINWQQGSLSSIDAGLLISEGRLLIEEEGIFNNVFDWQKGKFNLTLQDHKLTADLGLTSTRDHEIVNSTVVYSLTEKRIAKGKFTLDTYDISPLMAFIPELSTFEGMLSSQLNFSGDLEALSIHGKGGLKAAKAKIVGDNNVIEDINIDLNFKGQKALILGSLSINQGKANIKGETFWNDDFQTSINIDGQSLNLFLPPNLNVNFSPKINLSLTPSEVKLSGEVAVDEGKLWLNKLPQESVSLSKDVIIVDEKGQQVTSNKTFGIATDVRVLISDNFQIEGQGFEGRLGGELHVSQQAHQPLQLFGSLNFPEGRYRAYGQNLSIEKGVVSFNGSTNNPYIAIQAIRNIDKEDIIVGIDASGLADSLQVKLFSRPTMQQSETLSYLIRGRGLDAKTSEGNTALGMALGTALTNYSGVLTELEKLPLISNIEIEGDENQASLSGYVGDQVYLKYGIGITEPINELTVRFYLLNRLWIEAVSKLENSVDVYYSFDIE